MDENQERIMTRASIQRVENDPSTHFLNGKLNGLFYYYWDPALGENNAEYLTGTTEAITNITYVPFFDIRNEDLLSVPFDNERYGGPSGIRVYRLITPRNQDPKVIGEAPLYELTLPRLGALKNYKYESKLHDYPYRTIMFTSNLFNPYEIKPHLVDIGQITENKVELSAFTPVTAGGSFYLYSNGYKEDQDQVSTLERQFENGSMDIPNTSSAYSNYMSTQKAQTAVNLNTKLLNAKLQPYMGMAQAMVNGTGIIGRLSGMATAGAFGAFNGLKDQRQAINENLAMKQDLTSTPNSLKSAGGDLLTRIGVANKPYVYGGTMEITPEYKQLIGDYFHMYGYKQSKLMKINLRSRYFYNYIKTIGANIQLKRDIRVNIPTAYMEEIKGIFDNGVTLWHMDRREYKTRIGNYQFDNVEMSIVEGRLK